MLVLIVGCNSSYQDCYSDCVELSGWKDNPDLKDYGRGYENGTCVDLFCIGKPSKEVKEDCFNQCKNT